MRQAAVLLVVTFRSDSLHRTHPLRPLLAGLDRMDGVTHLELPRLSRDQVAAQLEGILGRPSAPSIISAVYERGGGNPLELRLRRLGWDCTIRRDDIRWVYGEAHLVSKHGVLQSRPSARR